MARARGLEPLTLDSKSLNIHNQGRSKINIDYIISNITRFDFPLLSCFIPSFFGKCDKNVTRTQSTSPQNKPSLIDR